MNAARSGEDHGDGERSQWVRFAGFVCLSLLIAMLGPVGTATAAQDLIPGASSRDHAWFAAMVDGEITLFHHSVQMNGPYYRTPVTLGAMPIAMAAWDNRVWIALPPNTNRPDRRRDVLTLATTRDKQRGLHRYAPPERMDLVASLPGGGRLVGMVGTAQGPVALIVPEQWRGAGVSAGDGSIAEEAGEDRPRLLRLTPGGWSSMPVPPRFGEGLPIGIASLHGTGEATLLLQESLTGAATEVFVLPSGAEAWTRGEFVRAASSIDVLTHALGQLVIGIRDSSLGLVDFGMIRKGEVAAIASIDHGGMKWTALGMRDGIHFIDLNTADDHALHLRVIDPLTGRVTVRAPMEPEPLESTLQVFVPLVLALLATTMLLAMVIRPGADRAIVSIPDGAAPLAPGRRVWGLLIDMVPGAVIGLLVTGGQLSDLLRFPVFTSDPGGSMTVIIMAAVTALHCAVGELLIARSLGKTIVGGWVSRAADGSRPTMGQIAIRNLAKLVTLTIPPLAIFALLNRHHQRLGDAMAGTVVLGRSTRSDPD